jgi:hypothetical protein
MPNPLRDFPCRQAQVVAEDECIPLVSGIRYWFSVFATAGEALNREQTATPQAALLRIEPTQRSTSPRTQIRTARRAPLRSRGCLGHPKGLVELGRRRSDPSTGSGQRVRGFEIKSRARYGRCAVSSPAPPAPVSVPRAPSPPVRALRSCGCARTACPWS